MPDSRLLPVPFGRAHLALLVALAAMVALARGAPSPAADYAAAALRFSDGLWDERSALLWNPPSREKPSAAKRTVRGTAWYAFGLLQRDAAGDRARAVRAIEAVLAQQVVAPGEPWDGTFFRAPDEPHPPLFARPWDDYDPNWRQFIGTTWALMLIQHADKLPAELAPRLEDSIRRAIEGEAAESRLKPAYTNIALMHAFLWGFAGERLRRPDWTRQAEEYVAAIHAAFAAHETFDEYNSPTYYGVDLYGLALLRRYGATPAMRERGAAMEAGLWRDVGRFYHAGLRNVCGPYDRGYGMDLTHYVGLVGLWIALAVEPEFAPVPRIDETMEHAHDLGVFPLYVALGARVPDDVLPHLRAFQGERLLSRVVTPQRTATAWLGDGLMIGGQLTRLSRAAGTKWSQFVPATVHWRAPGGTLGWIALVQCSRVDARAEPRRLTVSAIGDATFRIAVPGLAADRLARDAWSLPGLAVRVQTDATGFEVKPGPFWTDVIYRDATRFVVEPTLQP